MLSENQIKDITDRIVSSGHPRKVILFGSYASGNAGQDSDLDLLVIDDSQEDRHTRQMKIRRLFPRRRFALDVFVYTPAEAARFKDVKGTLINTAMQSGQILYEQ